MVKVEKETFKNWSETTTIKFAATTCSKNFLVIAAVHMFEYVYVFTLFLFPTTKRKLPLLFFVFTRDTLQSFDLTMTYQRACIYSVYPPDLIADVTRVPFETPYGTEFPL